MLGFIIKRNAPRKIGLQFCSSAFVDRIMKFKLTDMKPEDISTQIGSFPSASSLVNSQNKLFIQLAAMLPEHELKKAKETYMKRAIELFLQPGSVGQHGDLLRQFIVKSHMANLFTPELNRLFITKTVLRLVREGKTEELSQLSIDVYINILESCVLNDLLDPSEIFDCTKYAVEKLKFADRPLRYLTTLIVAHSLILKKYKGKAPEQTYANLVDSCLMVVSQSLQRLKSLPAEDSFEALMLMTHTLACLEIFKGHSKFRVFDTTWQLLELDFDQLIKRHAAQISNFIKEGEEAELLPILEDLNSMGSLYVTEMVKAILLPAIVARLELNYRKTSSSLVAQIINLAFKLDSKFEVAPKFLSALKLSKDDSLTSLQNASVSLDIFSKQQLTDSMGPYLDQLEDFLQSVIRNPDTKSSQSQVKLLLTIFKQLVQLGRGSVKLFKVYFDFFKQREVLEQVGLIPVLVQLLPSVGAKTKKLAGAMTNTSDEQSANVLNVTQAINNEIRPSITEIWKALDTFVCSRLLHIDIERLPSVIIQFVYGQIVVRDLQIFKQTAGRLKDNMGKLSAKQLAQAIYTLARANLPFIGEIISEGTEEFMKKTKSHPKEYSQERVAVLWSNAKSGVLDIVLFKQMLAVETPNIKNYSERTFVQLINAVGTLCPDLETSVLKNLLEQILEFFEKHGKDFQLQVNLGCAYHLLLFPQSSELKPLTDKIFNEISHLVGSQQKFLSQNFLLIYYLYLLMCHRRIRGAPMGELNRYNQILAKYQLEILNNYANSKKSSVSKAETRFKQILQTNKEKLGIDQIEDEDSRVLESGKMNWLLLPTAKVRAMVERQENLKEFTTKSLLVPYSIDILAGDNAFEVNGPFHYVRDSKTKTYSMNGHTKLKREFIEGVGLKYVEIPFWKLDEILLIHNDLQIAEIKNLMALQPGAKVQ